MSKNKRKNTQRRKRDKPVYKMLIDVREFPDDIKKKIKARHNNKCFFCGKGVEDGIMLTVAHIVPKSRGGLGVEQNGVPACGGHKKSCHWWLDFSYRRSKMLEKVHKYMKKRYRGWNKKNLSTRKR